MLVCFGNEQESEAFIANTTQGSLFVGRSMVMVDVQNEKIKQKINAEKSVKNMIFAHRIADSNTPFYLTGDIIMQHKKSVSPEEILAGFDVQGEIVMETETGIVLVRLKDWNTILAIANSIYESGLVEWCHPDFITPIQQMPT